MPSFDVWSLVKLFFLFGILIYIVFALVVVRQVSLMTSTVEAPLSASLRVLSWAHLAFAVFVFLLSLVIL